MARPFKSRGEGLISRSLKFPSSLWRRLEEQVPQGERAAFVRAAVEEKLEKRQQDRSAEATPVWELVTGIFSDLTEEERASLPPDLSENLDHYVYGTARK
jgi:Arc/MetJ-type ribon-helix-helix transcriptional regulator